MQQNFENSSSAAELLEKIMVIAHLIGKSENLGTKIDKLELDSECGPFFLEITIILGEKYGERRSIQSQELFFF